MKRILLPVDGSETCNKSFEIAKELAMKQDSEIILLNVNPPYDQKFHGEFPPLTGRHDENYRSISEKIIGSAVAKFEGTDIKVTSIIEDGYISSTIIDFAEKENIDLIVMCSHGMGGVKRFTLGSITHKVVMHATVPVLIAR